MEVTIDQPTNVNVERDTPVLMMLVSSMQPDEPTQPEPPSTINKTSELPAPQLPTSANEETTPNAGQGQPEDVKMDAEVPIPNPR